LALLLVVLYPLCKRFTYYPQLFLGLTFNSGILLSSTAIAGRITLASLLLYGAAICWTMIYDSFYAYQDIEDDIKIGVKSSALKFGKAPQKILYLLISMQISLLLLLGYLENFRIAYHLWILVAWCHLLCQVNKCDFQSPKDCLKKFKANFWTGLMILMALMGA
jgi:4-hydroxybenzoate polyprenyltransferase